MRVDHCRLHGGVSEVVLDLGTESSTVDECRHQAGRAAHGVEQRGGLGHAQHNRKVSDTLGTSREFEPGHVDAQNLATEEEERADGLVLGAGRDVPADGKVRGVVAHGGGMDPRPGLSLALGEVVEEAAGPVGVALLGAVRVVARAQSLAELLDRGERSDLSLAVDDGTGWRAVPVGTLEEVDEVETERVFSLADLPILRSGSLELFAESAYRSAMASSVVGRVRTCRT